MYSYRDTRAEVSLDAIHSNVVRLKRHLQPSCRLMAVVKADGYGHGAVEVALTAVEAGADYLAVAFVDEALQLRDAGIEQPILVLGHTPPRSLEAAVRQRIALTVFSEDMLDSLAACAENLKETAVIHIKFDTGMSRLGLTDAEETIRLAQKAAASSGIRLEGIFTHFADADAEDAVCTYAQFSKFAYLLIRLKQEGLHIPIKHCCNSAAALRFPWMHLDMVRIGIAMYGLHPSAAANNEAVALTAALQLKTAVSSLKRIPPNQPIGYGGTFVPARETVIAVLPVGYADGYARSLSNRGYVLIRGRRAPIVGRICMDQTMVDVTGLPETAVGDEVVLYGAGDSDCISVDEAAEWTHTIHYETVCLVGKRVPRLYFRHGRAASFTNVTLDRRPKAGVLQGGVTDDEAMGSEAGNSF